MADGGSGSCTNSGGASADVCSAYVSESETSTCNNDPGNTVASTITYDIAGAESTNPAWCFFANMTGDLNASGLPCGNGTNFSAPYSISYTLAQNHPYTFSMTGWYGQSTVSYFAQVITNAGFTTVSCTPPATAPSCVDSHPTTTTTNSCNWNETGSGRTYTSTGNSCTGSWGAWVLTANNCTVVPPSGSLSVTGCTVASGASTCTFNFSWNTANVTSGVRVTLTPQGGSEFNMLGDGSPANYNNWPGSWVAGTHVVKLYDSATGNLLDQKTVTIVGASAPPGTPTGSLTVSPSPCVIASGQSTCTFNSSWTTSNVTNGVRVTLTPQGGSEFNMLNDGSPASYSNWPANWVAGTHLVKLYDTRTGALLAQQPVTITSSGATQPNLTAGSITPTSAVAGTATSFSATITNGGGVATGRGFTNLFQKATDGSGTGATDIGTYVSAALSAGGSNAASLSYTFPSAGTYFLRACADKSSATDSGVIAESNENDNCGAWTAITVGNGGGGTCPSGQIGTPPNCAPNASCAVGGSCTSAANACGMTNAGTYDGSCSCSASAPSNSLCSASYAPTGEIDTPTDCSTFSGWAYYRGGTTYNIVTGSVSNPVKLDIFATHTRNGAGPSGGAQYLGTVYANQTAGFIPSIGNGAPLAFSFAIPNSVKDGSTYYLSAMPYALPFTGSYYATALFNSDNSGYYNAPINCVGQPTLALAASPTRVASGSSTKLTWLASNVNSCTLTGTNGFSSSATSGTSVDSGAITGQTTFTLSCQGSDGSTPSTSVTVNLVPAYIEQ